LIVDTFVSFFLNNNEDSLVGLVVFYTFPAFQTFMISMLLQ